MVRELIDKGWEHFVFSSKRTEERKDNVRWIYKVPNIGLDIALQASGYPVEKVRLEINEAEELASRSSILAIPKTRVFDMNVFGPDLKGTAPYIIAQEYIPEDRSVPNIPEALKKGYLDFLVELYEDNPRNFRSYQSKVYWLDPTHGYYRILESYIGGDYKDWIPIVKRIQKIFEH